MKKSIMLNILIYFYNVYALYDTHSKKGNENLQNSYTKIPYRKNLGIRNPNLGGLTSSSRYMNFVKDKFVWPYKSPYTQKYAQKVKNRITDKDRRIKNMMSRGSTPVDINVLFYSPGFKRTLYTLYMHHPSASTAFDHHHQNIDDINYQDNENKPISNVVGDEDGSKYTGSLVSETAFSMFGSFRR